MIKSVKKSLKICYGFAEDSVWMGIYRSTTAAVRKPTVNSIVEAVRDSVRIPIRDTICASTDSFLGWR